MLHHETIRKTLTFVSALGLAAAMSGAASAQSSPTAQNVSKSDSDFLDKTAQGSTYEALVAGLGVEKATSPMVRQYAQTLVLDHANFDVQLFDLAHSVGVVVPVAMTSDDQKRLSSLMNQNGSAFDNAFIAEEARINNEDVSTESSELGSTQNTMLRRFVTSIQEGDRFHLAEAQQLQNGRG